jgi:UDP-N-acetylglucosamine acyltransferase
MNSIGESSTTLYNASNGFVNIDGNFIHETAQISNLVELGTGNVIYPFAVIGFRGFVRGDKQRTGRVRIGDNNRIGAHVFIAHDVEIDDNNLIMSFVNIGHNSIIGTNNEIGAKTIICGHVTILNHAKIKVGCSIRNRIGIGNKAVIAMGSNVVKSVPSGASVMGNPAR